MKLARLLPGLLLLVTAASVLAEPAKEAKVIAPELKNVTEGEFWYRLEDAAGKAVGYSRLRVNHVSGGLHLAWEMKMSLPSGGYEEARTAIIEADRKLKSGSYERNGSMICSAVVRDGKASGEGHDKEGVRKAFETAIPEDAQTGLGFVLIPGLPREAGAAWTFTEIDEAQQFHNLGKSTVTCLVSETLKIEGKDVKVWRYDIKRSAGKAPVSFWADDAGRIAKAQWGPDLFQVISEKSTKDLYKFVPDALQETAGAKGRLVMAGDFKATPEKLYDWFTKDELLKKWWPQRTDIELKVGGKYHLFWDEPKWTLRGEIKACEPGKKFTFTWKWDDAPEPERTVELTFEAAKDGCKLTVNHGPYGDSAEEKKAREDVKGGWVYFGNMLRAELSK
ncbi:MAG: SRPBCC domain-containing protein [Planctomycetes bacterium]|nr:SRPBCC domain-containing protein [Planctomycetota bacterium]